MEDYVCAAVTVIFIESVNQWKLFTMGSRKIIFPSPPSAGKIMDEIHTDVGGTGH
jgi:hypothetical protein